MEHVLLDEGAREWLGLIEAKKKEFDKTVVALKVEIKRRGGLRSEKAQLASDVIIESLTATKSAAEKYVFEETSLFFETVFGITESCPVAIQQLSGEQTAALIASEMTARQLTDGTGVFTISGDSFRVDESNGLPQNDYLLVNESIGQKFVVLG